MNGHRVPDVKNFIARGDAADPTEFRGIVGDAFNALTLVLREIFDFGADRGAVLRRDVVNVIGAPDAVSAGHVRHDYFRMPGNVIGKMLRQHAGIEIVAAADRRIDENGNGLALKIIARLCLHPIGSQNDGCRNEQNRVSRSAAWTWLANRTMPFLSSGCAAHKRSVRAAFCRLAAHSVPAAFRVIVFDAI